MNLKKLWNKPLFGSLIFMLAFFSTGGSISAANEPKVITAVFQNFDDLSQLTLNNSTLANNPGNTGVGPAGQKVLRLTRAARQEAGSAFFTKRVSLLNQRSFSAHFSFQISGSGGDFGIPGADGLSFIIQTVNNNVGSTGGGIGYQGIHPSIAVEFDTWRNDEAYARDPNDNHIGINLNGNMISEITAASLPGNLKSGIWYAWVNYNGDTKKLEVRASQNSKSRPASPILSYDVDLKSVLNQDEVFVGFTSSTGSGWGNHDIRNFYFDNDNTVIDTDIDIYEAAPTQVTASASPAITNDSSLVTVEVKNQDNSPAVGKLVSFTTTLGTIQPTATTDANGMAQAVVSSIVSGTAAIKAVAVGGAYAETSVTFDTDAPVTSVSEIIPAAPDGSNDWYVSDPTVKLTAADNLSGVAHTEYRLNGGPWNTYTDGFVLGEGQHVIDYRSTDNLGNIETVKTIGLKSDHTAPVTSLSVNEAAPKGNGEWYADDAVVAFDAVDALSGVNRTEYRLNQGDWISYGVPFTLTEGVYNVEYRSVDQAGNTEQVRNETIQVDHTTPSFTISATPSQLWPANHKMVPVMVTLKAEDSGSRVAQIVLVSITSSEPANGVGDGNTSADIAGAEYGTADTSFELRAERSGNGTGRIYTITYLITDHAGNRTTASVTVTVPHDAEKK